MDYPFKLLISWRSIKLWLSETASRESKIYMISTEGTVTFDALASIKFSLTPGLEKLQYLIINGWN